MTGDVLVTVNSAPNLALHISCIEMSLTNNPGGTQANARVVIVDQNGAPRSGATVTGSWSGLVTGTTSGTTGADGSTRLTSSKTKKSGTFTFTVTNVSLSGFTYDPAANVVSSGSIVK